MGIYCANMVQIGCGSNFARKEFLFCRPATKDPMTQGKIKILCWVWLLSSSILTGCDGTGIGRQLDASDRDGDARPNIVVIVVDDQGYGDIGVNGILTDIKTPNIDKLAADGARFTSGYATAPQCTPSRAALITGSYQQKFGLDANSNTPLALSETTIADELQKVGYTTGAVGKWHLEIDQNSSEFDIANLTINERRKYFPDNRGFDDVYFGFRNNWWTNYSLEGQTIPAGYRQNTDYRLDVVTDAGEAFIERHKSKPFFLFLSYYAPHVPLAAPEEYLLRHEGIVETRRRYALAMTSAVDDGVGRIREKLEENNLGDNTLFFYVSDNGAPLGITQDDLPIEDNTGVWNGSLNTPWVGEKGMLSEGGIRVPFIVTWESVIAAGTVLDLPVTTLDIAATGLAAANTTIPVKYDGTDLLPHILGQASGLEDRPLFWRFAKQAAIRQGSWKYLTAGDREFLFNLDDDGETNNLLGTFPEKASSLRDSLTFWATGLQRPGIPTGPLSIQERLWYDHYIAE